MTRSADEIQALLARARALNEARDYPELHDLLARSPEAELLVEPELAFLLADVSRRVGQGERALEWVERLAGTCSRRGNDRLGRNRQNLEGILRFDRGEFRQAEAAWLRLLESASEAGDEEFVARANNNLGIICTLAGRAEESLTYYGRAVAAYQRLGHLRGLAQSHQNLAITYRELGFHDQADTHFRDALGYARDDGSEDEIGRVEQERAILMLVRGDGPLARITARRALERYVRLDDPVGQAEVRRVLGLVALAHGELDVAEAELTAARTAARDHQAALLEAECLEGLAAIGISLGDVAGAASLREEAMREFERLGAGAWGRLARERVTHIASLAPPPQA